MTEPARPDSALSARRWAEQWVAGAGVDVAGLGPEDRKALAWALKEICSAHWNSDLDQARRALQALDQLRLAQAASAGPEGQQLELGALHDWCQAMVHLATGGMRDAIAAFERSAAAFIAAGRAHAAAQVRVGQIAAHAMLGQHDLAEACAEQAQAALLEAGDAGSAGKVSLNRGTLQMRRHAYARAARHYQEAAVLCARAGDTKHSVAADIGHADALASTGAFDEAAGLYERARLRALAHGLLAEEAHIGESVALLKLSKGEFREALQGLELARRRFEQLKMPQMQAILERLLGDAYFELRLLPEAVALFEQARGTFEQLAVPDDTAWAVAQRGRAEAYMGNHAAAAASFDEAARLFEQQQIEAGSLAVDLARAELALVSGRPADALGLARAAAEGYRAAGMADAQVRAGWVAAESLLAQGSTVDAGAAFVDVLREAEALGLVGLQVRCLSGHGVCELEAGHEAAAQAALDAATRLLEDMQQALPGDDLRSSFLADNFRAYQTLLTMALRRYAGAPTPARAEQVLASLDRFRARSLGERAGASQSAAATDDATTALRTRLSWLQRRVVNLQYEGEVPQALVDQMRGAERALLESVRRQRIVDAAPAAGTSAVMPRTTMADDRAWPAALRDTLGPGDALVAYGCDGASLFACVVDGRGVAVFRGLAVWTDVADAVRALRFQIDALRHGVAPMQRHLDVLAARARQRLAALHRMIWAPLEPALASARRVVVVPHDALGSVPFAALGDGEAVLADRLTLSIAPSARVALRVLRRPTGPVRRVEVLADTVKLHHTAVEARQVAEVFDEACLHLGEAATLQRLAEAAGRADVLHLACHAQFRGDNPMFSALHLRDGVLTVEAAERLRLAASTVVLSACETGVAHQGQGNEMVGLVRAFMAGGAARVVASLWPVDDATTAETMVGFYRALHQGHSSADALRQAQRELRQRHAHPFFWAPFCVFGAW